MKRRLALLLGALLAVAAVPASTLDCKRHEVARRSAALPSSGGFAARFDQDAAHPRLVVLASPT